MLRDVHVVQWDVGVMFCNGKSIIAEVNSTVSISNNTVTASNVNVTQNWNVNAVYMKGSTVITSNSSTFSISNNIINVSDMAVNRVKFYTMYGSDVSTLLLTEVRCQLKTTCS